MDNFCKKNFRQFPDEVEKADEVSLLFRGARNNTIPTRNSGFSLKMLKTLACNGVGAAPGPRVPVAVPRALSFRSVGALLATFGGFLSHLRRFFAMFCSQPNFLMILFCAGMLREPLLTLKNHENNFTVMKNQGFADF